MEEILDFLMILGIMAAIAAAVWFWLKSVSWLDELMQRRYGIRLRRGRYAGEKVEIQTLFHGNTKDQDQI